MKFEEINCNKFTENELFGNIIYFLTKNEEVVYVGQSKKGIGRIYYHICNYKKKDFDSCYYIHCNETELNELENYYMIKYSPKYNKRLNNLNTSYVSFALFYYTEYKSKNVPRLTFQEAKNEIIKNNLYFKKFKNNVYLEKSQLKTINDFLINTSLKKYKK